jgi:hypothetical protein
MYTHAVLTNDVNGKVDWMCYDSLKDAKHSFDTMPEGDGCYILATVNYTGPKKDRMHIASILDVKK